MDYYSLNLSILREREPDLAKRLEMIEPRPDTIFDESRTKPLDPNLRLEGADVFAILGIGWGYHLVELILRAPSNAFILVIDPDLGLFKYLISIIDIRPIFKRRVSLAICEDPFTAVRVRLDNYFHIITLAKIKTVEYPPSIRLNPKYYEAIRYNLKEAIEVGRRNVATLIQFAGEWQRHILTNIEAIIRYPGVKDLFGKFKNQPAIIVAAGPSLDKNVTELSRAKGKALIIAVDTALKSLSRHNIHPDLVVSIDSSEANLKDFEGVSLTHETLVAVPVTHPKVFSLFGNSTFITSYGHPLIAWIERYIGQKGFTKVGGSVATTAFDLARNMEANPIIFVGQDLAYSSGLLTHARGVFVHFDEWIERVNKFKTIEMMLREYIIDKGIVWVEDIFGGRVMTSKLMSGWIKWLGSQIAEARRDLGILCIDATEGGAKIPGTEIMTLKEAINTFCKRPINVKKILSKARMDYKIPQLGPLIRAMEDMIKEWQSIEAECYRGQGVADELLGLLKEDKEEKRIKGLFGDLNSLFQSVINRHQVMETARWNIEPILAKTIARSSGNDPKENAKICQEFFERVCKFAQTTIYEMNKAYQKIVKITSNTYQIIP